MATVDAYDRWLDEDGPAALIRREPLQPAEGADGVVFPATFAAGDGFPGGYNIDLVPDGGNICLIDSVGSQANRIEPMFAQPPWQGLVPQIVITAGDRRVNLLDAGHRAADAVVRCSSLQAELRQAFVAAQRGDAEPLARLAPTSLVFGVWDSRDTQTKLPRLLASTIRAFNVARLTRSAQYVPAVPYVEDGLLDEPADKKTSDAYAERGFVHVPATASHGGVIARGGIRRDASLHLAALRLLHAGGGAERTLALRRYVLGLALAAFTRRVTGYLRQGCTLVGDPEAPAVAQLVHHDGRRDDLSVTQEAALAFALAAAAAFGIDPNRVIGAAGGPDREAPFDRAAAAEDVAGEGGSRRPARGRRRRADAD